MNFHVIVDVNRIGSSILPVVSTIDYLWSGAKSLNAHLSVTLSVKLMERNKPSITPIDNETTFGWLPLGSQAMINGHFELLFDPCMAMLCHFWGNNTEMCVGASHFT